MKNFFRKNDNADVPESGTAESVTAENGVAAKPKLRLDKRMILIVCAACLAVVCVVLAIVLPLCLTGGDGVYYKLTYDLPDGVEILIKNEDGADVKNGWEVKSGVNVNFALGYDGEAMGEPIVSVNDKTVNANGSGIYSFSMGSDTVITVRGVVIQRDYKVTFDRGTDGWINYSSEQFDISEPVSVKGGEQVTFDVAVSVYYKQEGFTVVANTTVVNPDDKGHYTFTVIGDTTVKVRDLEMDDPFSARLAEDGKTYYMDGAGTRDNPYRIRKPVDLYAMADLVGDDWYQAEAFYMAYYKLENDIDMKGERLYIIGDGFTSGTAVFAGNFDGGNHTISNYYIADEIVEQSEFTRVFTPYLGLFGRAVATTLSPAEIYDLNLENFTIEVTHASKTSFYAGGLVGLGEGVNITNCSVKGKIRAVADPDYRNIVGGVAGYLRSVASESVSYPSVIRSCSADVEVAGESGFIESAGGIVGQLVSYDAVTPSYVLNSYSTGDVYGAVRTGGIAGSVGMYSSVKNSYSLGDIEARSDVDAVYLEEYHHAYAGGIAGYVDYGAIISDSFAAGSVYANARMGSAYEVTDGIAAYTEVNAIPAGSYPALVLNSYSKADNVDLNAQFIQNTLKWDTVDWTFAGEYPAINKEIVTKSFTVTVNLGSGNTVGGKSVVELELKDVYSHMSGLFNGVYVGGKPVTLPQYLDSDAGLRTYGYYFDKELTKRIPGSYVPTDDMEIYVGFVDYKTVAGRYYLQSGVNGSANFSDYKDINGAYSLTTPLTKDAYIELNADGTLTFRNGVISTNSTYYFDGVRLTLEEVYVTFEEYYTLDETNKQVVAVESAYITFNAVPQVGYLDISDGEMYKAGAPLKAVKRIAGFDYGYYYSGNTTYLFNPDMTGERTENNVTTTFEYSVNGNTVVAGTETLNLTALTAFDAYYGVWEKSAGSNKQYVFDGKGNWTYEYFGYDSNGGKVVYDAKNGTYGAGALTLAGGGNHAAVRIEEGVLVIGNEKYYKQNSLTGTWRFPGASDRVIPVEITFGGISALGYGEAVVDYGDAYGNITLAYHAVTDAQGNVTIELYNGDYLYGSLVYASAEKTLTGSIISVSNGAAAETVMVSGIKFFLYDDFKGSWVSNATGFELVNFNGFGNYDVAGNPSHMAVKGEITVNGTPAGKYELVNGKLEGSFVYNSVTYSLVFDEDSKLIRISGGTTNAELYGFDGWQNIALKTLSGAVYEFDGRGNIPGNGGKVSVTPAGGTKTEYAYSANADGTLTVATLGTLAAADGKYTLGATDLYLKTDFDGNWLYRDANGELKTLSIGSIGPKNGGFAVSVTYGGKQVFAQYDAEHNEIYLDDGSDTEISLLVRKNNTETALSFALREGLQITQTVCIKALDIYEGEYVSADNGKIVFDGFGVSLFATGGAVQYGKDGSIVKTYTYSEDDGTVMLVGTEVTEGTAVIKNYIFKEVAEDAAAFGKGGKYYSIVEIDVLYNFSAFKRGSFNSVDDSVEYIFDGIGGLTEITDGDTENAVKYSYRIMGQNSLMMTYSLYVTDESGNIYSGTLNMSSANTLSLSERDKFFGLTVYGVDKDGKTDETVRYIFDGNGEGTLTFVQGEDAAVYRYTFVGETDGVCTFSVVSSADQNKKYTGVLTLGEKNVFVLTEIAAASANN